MKKDLGYLKHIGANIRAVRKSRNLTIEKLAECVEISPSFLGTVERSESMLGLESLIRICYVLEVSSDSLILDRPMPEITASPKLQTLFILLSNASNEEIEFLIEYVNLCHDKQIFKKNQEKQ